MQTNTTIDNKIDKFHSSTFLKYSSIVLNIGKIISDHDSA